MKTDLKTTFQVVNTGWLKTFCKYLIQACWFSTAWTFPTVVFTGSKPPLSLWHPYNLHLTVCALLWHNFNSWQDIWVKFWHSIFLIINVDNDKVDILVFTLLMRHWLSCKTSWFVTQFTQICHNKLKFYIYLLVCICLKTIFMLHCLLFLYNKMFGEKSGKYWKATSHIYSVLFSCGFTTVIALCH